MINTSGSGLQCQIGKLSDNSNFRLVLRTTDNNIFIEGHYVDIHNRKRAKHNYFLKENLTLEDMRELHEITETAIKMFKKA